MRQSFAIAVSFLVFGCASTAERANRPACDVRSTCFNERSVRNFMVLDDETLVVEVGGARCPYLVEVDGIFCDLNFAATIAFRDNNGRVCAVDRTLVLTDPFVTNIDDVCRVRSVRAVSDDELLERYADRGRIPPLPPSGSGELRVEAPDEGATPPGGPAPAEAAAAPRP